MRPKLRPRADDDEAAGGPAIWSAAGGDHREVVVVAGRHVSRPGRAVDSDPERAAAGWPPDWHPGTAGGVGGIARVAVDQPHRCFVEGGHDDLVSGLVDGHPERAPAGWRRRQDL